MVPLLVTILIPLVAAVGHEGHGMDMDMNTMMTMMNMMQQAKGWGAMPQPDAQWYNAKTEEDNAAYLKWCEENRLRLQEQAKQQELLDMYAKREAERKAEAEKERVAHEAEERQEAMMYQWKMWQTKLEHMHEFEGIMGQIVEAKHVYYYLVTMEFLRFCKCSDFTETISTYFQHDGLKPSSHDWDLDDLEGIDSTDVNAVAQALANRPEAEQIKAFFGGLARAVCEGGRAYIAQVEAWDKKYDFMNRLM